MIQKTLLKLLFIITLPTLIFAQSPIETRFYEELEKKLLKRSKFKEIISSPYEAKNILEVEETARIIGNNYYNYKIEKKSLENINLKYISIDKKLKMKIDYLNQPSFQNPYIELINYGYKNNYLPRLVKIKGNKTNQFPDLMEQDFLFNDEGIMVRADTLEPLVDTDNKIITTSSDYEVDGNNKIIIKKTGDSVFNKKSVVYDSNNKVLDYINPETLQVNKEVKAKVIFFLDGNENILSPLIVLKKYKNGYYISSKTGNYIIDKQRNILLKEDDKIYTLNEHGFLVRRDGKSISNEVTMLIGASQDIEVDYTTFNKILNKMKLEDRYKNINGEENITLQELVKTLNNFKKIGENISQIPVENLIMMANNISYSKYSVKQVNQIKDQIYTIYEKKRKELEKKLKKIRDKNIENNLSKKLNEQNEDNNLAQLFGAPPPSSQTQSPEQYQAQPKQYQSQPIAQPQQSSPPTAIKKEQNNKKVINPLQGKSKTVLDGYTINKKTGKLNIGYKTKLPPRSPKLTKSDKEIATTKNLKSLNRDEIIRYQQLVNYQKAIDKEKSAIQKEIKKRTKMQESEAGALKASKVSQSKARRNLQKEKENKVDGNMLKIALNGIYYVNPYDTPTTITGQENETLPAWGGGAQLSYRFLKLNPQSKVGGGLEIGLSMDGTITYGNYAVDIPQGSMNLYAAFDIGFIPTKKVYIYFKAGYGFRMGLANYRTLPESFYPDPIYGVGARKFIYNHEVMLGLGVRYKPEKSNVAIIFEVDSDLVFSEGFLVNTLNYDKVITDGKLGLKYVLPRTIFGLELIF